MTYSNARDVFRQCVQAVGVESRLYGLHSLRRGAAAAAARAGLQDRVIQLQGR